MKDFGQWTEQISSSGKKFVIFLNFTTIIFDDSHFRYYYNKETFVSQWDKPTEWKLAEKTRGTGSMPAPSSKNGGGSAGGGSGKGLHIL